jgi:hypothetical protein
VSCHDHGFVVNGILDGPSQPATVSWDLEWSGPIGRSTVNDNTNRFRLDAVETKATINWSADGSMGFKFTADPASSNTIYALVGKERNGRFF